MRAKTIWFTDLDNTLIHSYKSIEPRDICVEHKTGKKQGFINADILSKLIDLQRVPKNELQIVPITTRSYEQYLRITLFDVEHPLVVTTNGGRIIKKGTDNFKYLHQIFANNREELMKLRELFRVLHKEGASSLKLVDQMFLCAVGLEKELGDRLPDGLETSKIGSKVYVALNNINKLYAMEYLLKGKGEHEVICSGDSELDFCMFGDIADTVYTLEENRGKFKRSGKTVYTGSEYPGYEVVRMLHARYNGGKQ